MRSRLIGRDRIMIVAALLFMLAGVTIWAVQSQILQPQQDDAHFVMNTILQQTVYSSDSQEAASVMNGAAALLAEMESVLTAHREGSTLFAIQKNAGRTTTPVDAQTMALLQAGISAGRLSGGVFDITTLPLSSLWGIGTEDFTVPDAGEIEAARALVRHIDLVISESAGNVYLPRRGQGVDLGGIAKGAALDALRTYYTENGIKSAIVSLGGNVLAHGQKPDGTAFIVALRNPDGAGTIGTLELSGTTISTSGGYERYSERGGVRYHHILDPRTGYPAVTDLLSVSVIGPDGAACDWMSTWLFIVGRDEAVRIADELSLSTVLVDVDHRITLTGGASALFTLTSDDYSIR